MTLIRKPLVVLAPAAVLVVALALATNVVPFRQLVEQRQQVAASRARLTALETENAKLRDEVAALQTPLEIERLAREKLGLVREGEEAYVVLEPAQTATVFPEDELVPAAEPAPEERPWYLRLWDYVTGRDLVGSR